MDAIVVLTILAVLGTFGILVAGGVSMVLGGKFDALHALPLMEARVVLQGTAVLLVVIAVMFW